MAKKLTKSKVKVSANAGAGKTRRAAPGTTKASPAKRGTRSVETGKGGAVKHVVSGTVSYPDKSPAVGLTVVAFDKDVGGEDRLGEAVTDDKGAYRIEYDDARFRRSPGETRGADIFVRVLSASGGQLFQSKARRNAPRQYGLSVSLPVGRFVVRGTVRDAGGKALPGLSVSAFDCDLRRREPLGVSATDDGGRYEIYYASRQFSGAESAGADLQVVVFESPESGRPLAESAVFFNVGGETTIDIRIAEESQRRSEFETHLDRLKPLLEGQAEGGRDLGLVELTDADAGFLASETGIDRRSIELLREAHRVGNELDAKLAVVACYGWFRKGIAASRDAVRATSSSELRRLLLEAIDETICPASLRPSVDAVLDGIGQPQRGTVRRLLGGIGLKEAQAGAVAQQLDSVEAIDEIALNGLAQSGVLEQAQADRLGLSASLYRLTNGGESAVALALERPFGSLGGRPPSKSEDLARLEIGEWATLLENSAAPVPEGSTIEEFASTLMETCAGAYPTVAMMQRALRVESDAAAALKTFSTRNPGLDLLSLDLTTDSDDLAKLDRGALTETQARAAIGQLRTLQRVLSVAGHPTVAEKLLDGGYRHATRIALATEAELIEQAGLSETEAIRVLDSAHTASLAAVHAWMAVRDAQTDQQMISGVGSSMSAATAAGGQIARWAEMFGPADACDCDHCQSVLGPGAYFVDLMHYIERFILAPGSGVDTEMQLSTRRGDLWADKLVSCVSTDEIVPTLDIVNGLLESWITRQKPQWTSPTAIHREIANPASSKPGFGIPLNFPLDRLEILLAHFGVSRDRVVQVLGGNGQARIQSRLRSWPAELGLIQNARADDTTAALYFEQLYRTSRNLPNGPGRLDQVTDTFSLTDLQIATGLGRDVVRLLVSSRFVSTDGSTVPVVTVTLTSRPGDVQNTVENVGNLTRRRLDRLHRLARLWRKLPWTVPELDYALLRLPPVVSPAALGDAKLNGIVELLDLVDATGLAFDEVMALWDDLPREGFRGQAALFDRRFNAEPFRARSGVWPGALPVELPLPVTPTSTAGSDSSAARLLSALRMNEADFAELIDALRLVEVPDPVNPVRLVTLAGAVPGSLRLSNATLPVLYRHALLCRVLKVRPAQLMRLVRLTPEIAARATLTRPLDALSVTGLADLLSLRAFVAWQRDSGFTPEDLAWLLDATRRPDAEPDPDGIAARVVKRIADERLAVFPPTLFASAGFSESESRAIMASLEGSAIERTVVEPAPGAQASAATPSAQELDYRLRQGLTAASLDGLVATAIAPWAFDIGQTAVFGIARKLGEFADDALTALSLTATQSREIVALNLDDGVAANPRRPFARFTAGTATRYRLNPSYFTASAPAPFVVPQDPAGNAINLSGIVVLGFLKGKAQAIAQPANAAARAITDTLFTEIFLSEQQSRWLVGLNPVVVPNTAQPAQSRRAFLQSPAGNGFILNVEDIVAATQPPLLGDTLAAVRRAVADLLWTFDPLKVVDRVVAAELGMPADMVTALKALPAGALNGMPGGLQAADPAEVLGDRAKPEKLALRIGQLQRLKRLFDGSRFDAAAVARALSAWATGFAGAAGAAVDIVRLRAIAGYGRWLRLQARAAGEISASDHETLRFALDELVLASGTAALSGAQWNTALARVLAASESEVRSLKECPQLWQGRWHVQLDRAATALEIARRLGIGGRTLVRICGFDAAPDAMDDLLKAADDIYGAFRARYPDEKAYREKSEAFEDLIRGRRRDALVAYVLANSGGLPLQTPSDLYGYFLMDVEAGGCARTSRLVAAISSVQLFVHRVMMGLERDRQDRRFAFGPSRDAQQARDQWYWRKNYRVWEANRKVFLFPENFIEPDLRDDKTPLFRSLEDELLQRRITTAEAEESYRNYLTGYSEVTGLKIVGAVHDLATGRDLGVQSDEIFIDTLHLVGVTADDPPLHYLRQVGNLARSRTDPARFPVQFSPWEKLGAQIPVRWVTPAVQYRKLHLFWNEITTVSTSRRLKEGTFFDGYKHRFKVKWVGRKATGGWTAPQEITFLDSRGLVKRAYTDDLVFTLSPQVPATVTRRKTGPNAAPGGEDQVFSVPSPRPAEALPALEQGQPEAAATVYLGTVERRLGNQVVNEPVSQDVAFRAAPRTESHHWNSMRHHGAAEEEFTVAGWNWEIAYPAVRYTVPGAAEELQVTAMNSDVHGILLLPERRVAFLSYQSIVSGAAGLQSAKFGPGLVVAGAQVFAASGTVRAVGHHVWEATALLKSNPATGPGAPVLSLGAPVGDALVVNSRAQVGAPGSGTNVFRASCILHSGNLQALLCNDPAGLRFLNLGTSTAETLVRRLATASVAGLLDTTFQRNLAEKLTAYTLGSGVAAINGTNIDFGGPFGAYLREIFFQVPFLVANHLNSEQRFEESQRWYHYIFNPVAQDPGGVWRYREFVNRPVETMRQALTDPAALAAYRNDPFNPHAIARLRWSAYQKAIVMKYIDNLLDWGDRLFGQFTMESINEATMLYVLAADILGERPNRLPRCVQDKARSYEDIKPSLSDVSDFLIEEMEQLTIAVPKAAGGTIHANTGTPASPQVVRMASTMAAGYDAGAQAPGTAYGSAQASGFQGLALGGEGGPKYWSSGRGQPLATLYTGNSDRNAGGFSVLGTDAARYTPPIDFVEGGGVSGYLGTGTRGGTRLDPTGLLPEVSLDIDIKYTLHDVPPPHREVFEQPPPRPNPIELVPARNLFCFPINRELLDYHDRVRDRLTKIRNCMDIAGVRRRLALFAPEIDPRLLVRMKAAGLSLEDVLDSGSGHAPPYRFLFLIERARQYASTVQSFGSQLLSVLEKRDSEELAVLRTVHEQHLLDLRTQSMRLDLDAANDALEGLMRQKEAAELRQQHFESLLAGGLIPSEQAQQALTVIASALGMASSTTELIAAVVGAIPQVHTPTMTGATAETGGHTAANVLSRIASASRAASSVADLGARAAGAQASYDRRAQDWSFQRDVARKDVAQIGKQIEAAEIRVAIAERALEIHQRSIDQTREIYNFHRSKFSSLGLYTWLSTQLHRYHRMAFDVAWNMARQAETALHFERPELRETAALGAPAWAAERAGLLAGEGLLLDLQRLESAYLLTNTRQIEIEQSFSLAQFFPDQLVALRQTGECDFTVPEFFFDLFYPGHYSRRIKAVRLSMPCVVGPHTSVGATLRITGSFVRNEPDASQPLTEVPLRHAPTIASSSAQNDAGVFEFSFRDERLLPFEGMGAISSWSLRLPQKLRSFQYGTISDVVLRIAYTAREDEVLRSGVDSSTGAILRRLQDAAPRVAISLRRDFPVEWSRFRDAVPTADGFYSAAITLTEQNYPWWLRNRLVEEEDLALHVLFDKAPANRVVTAKLGTGTPKIFDEIPPPPSNSGLHWVHIFPLGKQVVAASTTSRTFTFHLDRKDMSDVVIVLAPGGSL